MWKYQRGAVIVTPCLSITFCRDNYGLDRNRAKSHIKFRFSPKSFTRRKIPVPLFFSVSIPRSIVENIENQSFRALKYVNRHGNYELDSRPTFSPKTSGNRFSCTELGTDRIETTCLSDEYKTNLKHRIKKILFTRYHRREVVIFMVVTLQNFLNIDYKFDRIL